MMLPLPMVTHNDVPVNLADSADWPKATLDLPAKSAEELRAFLDEQNETVEHFKELPAYTAALASGNYPWLADL